MTPSTSRPRRLDGLVLIAVAVQFSMTFSILSAIFDYPQILRRPAAEILQRVQAGGPLLLLTWYGFALAAVGLIPVVLLMRRALRDVDGQDRDIATALGLTGAGFQAIGLIRWVFAIPVLAAVYGDPTRSQGVHDTAIVVFQALHQFAGVAVGETLGQVCTAAWVFLMALGQMRASRPLSVLGLASAALIVAGLPEELSTVIGFDPGPSAAATPLGYLGLTLWILAAGVLMLRGRSASALAAA